MFCKNGGSNQIFGFTAAKSQDCQFGEPLRHAAAKVPAGRLITPAQSSIHRSIKLFANSESGLLALKHPNPVRTLPPNINVLLRPLTIEPLPLERHDQ